MIKPPELLETSRLLLRLPVLEDSEAFFLKCAQDREFVKYVVWRPHENINVTRDFIQRCIRCWQDETAFPWVVVRKNDRDFIGIFEIRIDKFRADLGYGIAREYWGNGYATEITKSVIAWALMQLKVILETGELRSPELIRKASRIAIDAGADLSSLGYL